MGPHCWLKIGGECHLDPPDQEPRWYSKPAMLGDRLYPGIRLVDGNMTAHMNLEQAIKVRDALTEWIDMVPERWGYSVEQILNGDMEEYEDDA